MSKNKIKIRSYINALKNPDDKNAIYSIKLIFAIIVIVIIALINPAILKVFANSKTAAVTHSPATAKKIPAVNYYVNPDPAQLTIASLNINAPFELLGLNPDHTIQVPKNNMGVGWFVYGARPGEIGASVIVGHLDSTAGRAVFADLNKIKQGDKIVIKKTDGSEVVYRVNSSSNFSQDNFPTQAVYGQIPYAGLRLITCSGTWNKKAGHYSNNLVVFASKI